MDRIDLRENTTREGLSAIYRQEIIQNVTLFVSQSAAVFYDKLFTYLDFALPKATTGQRDSRKKPWLYVHRYEMSRIHKCTLLDDKGYTMKSVYNLVKTFTGESRFLAEQPL